MAKPDRPRIVTVWAEHAAGPGWSNTLYWAITRNREGKYEQVAIQPDKQTALMVDLHRVSREVHGLLCREAEKVLYGKA